MTTKISTQTMQEASERLSALAEEAVKVFHAENAEAFKELTKAFEGKSANLALLGHGRFHVCVQKSEVKIEPNVIRSAGQDTSQGVIAPETLLDIVEGRITPLQAFFKGDLTARSNSDNLHLVYDYFVRFSDTAMGSKKLRGLIGKFREMTAQPTCK